MGLNDHVATLLCEGGRGFGKDFLLILAYLLHLLGDRRHGEVAKFPRVAGPQELGKAPEPEAALHPARRLGGHGGVRVAKERVGGFTDYLKPARRPTEGIDCASGNSFTKEPRSWRSHACLGTNLEHAAKDGAVKSVSPSFYSESEQVFWKRLLKSNIII